MAPIPKFRDEHAGRTPKDSTESLMGHQEEEEEQQWQNNQNRRRSHVQRISDAISPWRWLVDGVLFFAIIGLLLERRSSIARSGYCEFESTGDITGFAPKVSQQIKKFVPDFSYFPDNASEFSSPATKQKWLDLVPKGLGYVKVDHPERHNNLPHRLVAFPKNTTAFTTSVTHQLHCLHAIAATYNNMLINNTNSSPNPDDMAPWHINHCFEYLRQTIMCCGDTALEGEATTFPENETGSDGWDATHICKNYDQIHSYLEEKRALDEVWV
ncbi:hypothetical protein PpBr36_04901 [Pyricularia pennisetigena]|uniref:hypothetical protein n=1 Tax=Pyricularia pennisetigena TaxID=1578925 RepID=UPI0011540D85|nr:hypothetical protein PpBr36_04901 [Pyricularia pennisetigena]TLS27202.1 hypothetical protein PpBr36_04901 [Pyricularia pennisetigena]